jgi:alpha-pyrone synthase
VLHDFGNMSSATVMFVLARLLAEKPNRRAGIGLGFGPGIGVESLAFREAA